MEVFRKAKNGLSLFIFISFLVCLFAMSAAQALASPDLRVAYVDVQKALSSSKAGADAQKRYEGELKRAQSQIDSKKSEYEKLQQSLEKQRASLNAKALSDKEEELISMEKDLKRSFQDKKEELRRENMRLVGELVNRIRKVVDDYGKEKGFTLILERGSQSVLYADSSIDITEEVVKRFDSAK